MPEEGDTEGEPAAVDSPQVRAAVDAAMVGHLYAQGRLAYAINVALAGVVLAGLWGNIDHALLVSWGAALAGINVGRMLLVGTRQRAPRETPGTWPRRHILGLCASSALWGLAAPLFLPGAPASASLTIAIALAGVAAGGLPLNAAVLPVYLTHVGLTLAPLFATFLALGGRVYVVLALMILAFAVTLGLAGRAYCRNLRNANLFARRLDEANRTLERRVSHDPLTGLWNRQRLETELDAELERVGRYGSYCGLIMLDVDHFKQVNDVHGHEVGDRVLAHLGKLLASETRSPDSAARWGGEEFMILLPETDAEAAQAVAERIRRRVAESAVDGPGHITISLGVTTASPGEERSTLLRRLDGALYHAKDTGRDRVHAEPSPVGAGDGAVDSDRC